jgi:FHA domain
MAAVSGHHPADAAAAANVKGLGAAERSGRPVLGFCDGDGQQQLFCLPADARSASVGRDPASDLVLGWDTQVSRRHARFEREPDGWAIVDEGLSTNGTFVNGERLHGRHRLADGDTVRFGSTAATFRSPAPDPAAPPVELSSTQRRVLAALCRPFERADGFARPASDQQIADELVLAVGEVRAHIRVLCVKLGVEGRHEDEMRVHLAERALSAGLLSERPR